jgi:hypothetical protein
MKSMSVLNPAPLVEAIGSNSLMHKDAGRAAGGMI